MAPRCFGAAADGVVAWCRAGQQVEEGGEVQHSQQGAEAAKHLQQGQAGCPHLWQGVDIRGGGIIRQGSAEAVLHVVIVYGGTPCGLKKAEAAPVLTCDGTQG